MKILGMKSVQRVVGRVVPTRVSVLPAKLRGTVNTIAAKSRDKVYKNIWRIL